MNLRGEAGKRGQSAREGVLWRDIALDLVARLAIQSRLEDLATAGPKATFGQVAQAISGTG